MWVYMVVTNDRTKSLKFTQYKLFSIFKTALHLLSAAVKISLVSRGFPTNSQAIYSRSSNDRAIDIYAIILECQFVS